MGFVLLNFCKYTHFYGILSTFARIIYRLFLKMSCILHIETSTDVCSVAISQDGANLFERIDEKGPNHAVILGTFVDEAISFADSHTDGLQAVAISRGPGSYTGLRIGTSMAKGICYGRNLPLIAVSTLELLCVPVLLNHDDMEDEALLCPMLDARRMEVYAGVYDRALNPVRTVAADIVTPESYREYLDCAPVYFFGNGAAKCKDTLGHPNARFIDGITPRATWMFPLADKKMKAKQFEDVAYFTPFYLKDFVAKMPSRPLL